MPRAARTAVTVVFFASGAAYGSFVSRIPALKETLGAGEAELGLVLLAGAIGSVVFLPRGGLADRTRRQPTRHARGARRRRGEPAAPCARAVAARLRARLRALRRMHLDARPRHERARRRGRGTLLAADLLLLPCVVERGRARRLPASAARRRRSACHRSTQFSGVALVHRGDLRLELEAELLPREADARPTDSGFRRPSPALLALAALAFAGLLAEGAAADWSGVYLDDSVGTGKAAATVGFAAFAATMTLGPSRRRPARRKRWGPVSLTRRAGLLAAAGMAVALGVGDAVSAVVGFACLGAGLATVVPTVFRAAGRRAASPGAGIAAVSTVGYSAFLVGPPAIGFLAEAVGLRAALDGAVALCLLIAVLAGATRVA